MKLTKGQNRFVNNKFMGVSFLKGKKDCGKTTASIYRAINLENNYCLFDDDKVLYLSLDSDSISRIKEQYDILKGENRFYSLFSSPIDKVEIKSLKDMILYYSNKYENLKDLKLEHIPKESILDILGEEDFLLELSNLKKQSKLLKKVTGEELLEEMLWIKSSNLSLDEYLNCERKGRKRRIRKTSSSRKSIYRLMEVYSGLLRNNLFMDKFDMVSFASEFIKEASEKFTHIIVDGAEKLTKGELDFIKSLLNNSTHSSLTLIIDTDENVNGNSWFIKGRKTVFLDDKYKNRNYLLKTSLASAEMKKDDFLDKYKYINLKYKNETEFNIDSLSNNREIYLNDNTLFKEEELKEVPVFNEIAAGNPIEINEEITDSFYLPSSWLERGKDTFILQVKGDSMVDKNILDGDLVVVKKQPIAYNNEIVAASIDGEATLKILNTNDEYPKLMPANSRYNAINLINREVSILGVAIGIIKYNN